MRRVLLISVVALGGLMSVFWLLTSIRLIALPLAALTIVYFALFAQGGVGAHRWVVSWVAAMGLTLSPIDATLQNVPGSPRLVPLIQGLPTAEGGDACLRGQAVCSGCVFSRHAPRWVVVW
jgi:hypothetical protein